MRRNLGWVVAVLSTAAWADVPLKQLLESADRQNVDRRMSAEQRLKAEADYRSAWTSLLPALTAQGVWTNNQYDAVIKGFPIDLTTVPPKTQDLTLVPKNQFDGVLRFDLPLVDTGRWARVSASASSQQSAAVREQLAGDVLHRQVVSAYYGYAAALAVRESAQHSLSVAEAQLKLQDIREKAGAVTELELLRARAEAERNKQVIADTENLVAVSRRSLTTLTGLDPGEVAQLPADDTNPEPGFADLEKNVDGLPAVRAAEGDAEAASRLAWGSRLAMVPLLGAQFTERFTNATSFTGKVASYTAGLNLTWRLDVPTFTALESARALEATAALGAERARLMSRDQIFSDWQRLTAALTKMEAAKAQVQAAQRAAEVARDKYAVGLATQVDVIQAERDLFGAEVGQIQARTEAVSARVGLRISAGLPLGLD